MSECTLVTVTVHSHVDKACIKWDGTNLSRWEAWAFKCYECRGNS